MICTVRCKPLCRSTFRVGLEWLVENRSTPKACPMHFVRSVEFGSLAKDEAQPCIDILSLGEVYGKTRILIQWRSETSNQRPFCLPYQLRPLDFLIPGVLLVDELTKCHTAVLFNFLTISSDQYGLVFIQGILQMANAVKLGIGYGDPPDLERRR